MKTHSALLSVQLRFHYKQCLDWAGNLLGTQNPYYFYILSHRNVAAYLHSDHFIILQRAACTIARVKYRTLPLKALGNVSKECFLQANPSLQPLHISTAKKLCASSRIELNQGLILCKFPSPTQVLLSGLYLPNYVSQQCLRTDLTKRVSNLPRGNCAEMKPSRPPNTQVTEKTSRELIWLVTF